MVLAIHFPIYKPNILFILFFHQFLIGIQLKRNINDDKFCVKTDFTRIHQKNLFILIKVYVLGQSA